MRNLESSIVNIFRENYRNGFSFNAKLQVLMEMPIDTTATSVELPVCMAMPFRTNPDVDKMVLPLVSHGYRTGYKSLEGSIRYIFCNNAASDLVSFDVKNGDYNIRCYGCSSGLFLEDGGELIPLVVPTMKLQQEPDGSWVKTKVIFRINPYCYHVSNTITRFITGKFMRIAVATSIYSPSGERTYISPEVIIGTDTPYRIIAPISPNIRTSREDLIKAALDNLDNAVLL